MSDISKPFRCIVVSEGEYDTTKEFLTLAEREAFEEGVETAASLYGAGTCWVVDAGDLGSFGSEIDALIREHLL